jgi:hypothetical protein
MFSSSSWRFFHALPDPGVPHECRGSAKQRLPLEGHPMSVWGAFGHQDLEGVLGKTTVLSVFHTKN